MQINKRKAVTEISSVWEASRESGVWWKPFMRKIRENHSVAAPPKAYAKRFMQKHEPEHKRLVKRRRTPTLQG